MILFVSPELLTATSYADDETAIEPEEPPTEHFRDNLEKEYDESSSTIAKGTGKNLDVKSGSIVTKHEIEGKMHQVLKVTGKLTIINTDEKGQKDSKTNLCWVRLYFDESKTIFFDILFWVTYHNEEGKQDGTYRECSGDSPDADKSINLKFDFEENTIDWHITKNWEKNR